jgi:hypothetical protein
MSETLHSLVISIERALEVANMAPPPPIRPIVKVNVVRATPFYGYHGTEVPFIQFFLSNPSFVGKVAGLLNAGAVMGRPFQPHEAHIPYLLQFLADFGLTGMSSIVATRAAFRSPLLPAADAGKHVLSAQSRKLRVFYEGAVKAMSPLEKMGIAEVEVLPPFPLYPPPL